MKTRSALSLITAASCAMACEATPPPQPPPAPPPPAASVQPAPPPAQVDQGAIVAETMSRLAAEGVKAQQDQVQAQRDATLQVLAQQEANAKAEAERKRQLAREECDRSRAGRVSSAQTLAKAWVDKLQRVKPHETWILANCKVRDTRRSVVEIEHQGNKTVVGRKELGEAEALSCSGRRPAGVTDELVRLRLVDIEDEIASGQRFGQNCETDATVKLNLEVGHLDFQGIRALLEWKP